jgi:Protein of unknown function (DUF3105)
MARKDRAPNPPRRVQAPQQRKTQRTTSGLRDRRLLIAVAAGAAVLALVVVLGAVFVAGGNGGDGARATLEDAGCTLQIVDSVTNASDHSDVPTVDTKVDWNTDPPSNGKHYGNTAVFGRYDEPLQQQLVVHNYEHGAVGIQYGSQVPDATVQQLRDYYDDDPNGLLLAPYPSLGDRIALTAWWDETPGEGDKGKGVVAKCPNFDEGAFDAFLDSYGFQGPEAFPRDALQPGSN